MKNYKIVACKTFLFRGYAKGDGGAGAVVLKNIVAANSRLFNEIQQWMCVVI